MHRVGVEGGWLLLLNSTPSAPIPSLLPDIGDRGVSGDHQRGGRVDLRLVFLIPIVNVAKRPGRPGV